MYRNKNLSCLLLRTQLDRSIAKQLWQSFTASTLPVLKSFVQRRLKVKSKECRSALPNRKHSNRNKIKAHLQGGPKKPDCFSDLITLWWLVLERRAVCQNFRNFIEKKAQNWHFDEFKYSSPNLFKSSQQLKLCYIWPEHMDFIYSFIHQNVHSITLKYSETTVIFPQS